MNHNNNNDNNTNNNNVRISSVFSVQNAPQNLPPTMVLNPDGGRVCLNCHRLQRTNQLRMQRRLRQQRRRNPMIPRRRSTRDSIRPYYLQENVEYIVHGWCYFE
jgi:hypothetical protein